MQSLQASAEFIYIILFLKNECILEWDLVSQSQHNHAVLVAAGSVLLLTYISKTEVVTSVDDEVANLVGSTQRN